jgi:hypothetical protein
MDVYEVTWTIKHTRVIEADSKKEAIWFSENMGFKGIKRTESFHEAILLPRIGGSLKERDG